MAQVFHFDCKPVDASVDTFKTLNSRYAGTCHGCGQRYSENDRIAYFGDRSKSGGAAAGTAPGGVDPSMIKRLVEQELAQMKKDIIDLKNSTRRHGDLISGCVSESISLHRFLKDKGIVPAKDVNQLVAKTQETSMEEAAAVMGGSVVNLNGAAEDVY